MYCSDEWLHSPDKAGRTFQRSRILLVLGFEEVLEVGVASVDTLSSYQLPLTVSETLPPVTVLDWLPHASVLGGQGVLESHARRRTASLNGVEVPIGGPHDAPLCPRRLR